MFQQQLVNHLPYLMALDKSKDLESIGYYLSEHLKVAGGYWTINAIACLNKLDEISQEKKQQLSKWLKECQNQDGGFGGNTNHDSHITNTHYAILLSFLLGCELDYAAAAKYVAARQRQDGSFEGDQWGEVDARFSYCGLSSLTLLNKRDLIDIKKAASYIKKCRNFDGSFGGIPDAESHGAYVFCCVGTLYLCEDLTFNIDELSMWIHERQTSKGGLNGRPEKLADVCYSWWMYSALCLLKREQWINQQALENYILECQDNVGGIADRPNNQPDVFHTFFGLAALSLLNGDKYQLNPIDPAFALPKSILINIPGASRFIQS
ncbi:unnamed protein product [Paramecium primaurelia]|uniref:Geranylgeranyl transferase type-2 subunit beta n=1 Tax=Paramecium primaurelia TaxID=5886 RepID=A0A8S1N9E2_PARPR|nr:unnamed protein product [Paramecium primaurelia]